MIRKSQSIRLPRYKRVPERFGRIEPTARDIQILRRVHDYGHLTVDHINALVPGSKRQIARRLQGLFHHAFLTRLIPPLRMRLADDDRPIGSPKFIYAIDKHGAQALSQADGVSLEAVRWDRQQNTRMHWFIEHRLMISAFRASIELALASAGGGIQHLEWRDERDIRDSVSVRYSNGEIREHRIAPDGYFAVRENSEHRNFFLEVDRATEEHPRLLRKFQGYWWYLTEKSPYYERFDNPKNRLVLVVTTSKARLQTMRRTLAKVDPKGRGLNQFWFTTQDAYDPSRPSLILRPIWLVGPSRRPEESDVPRALFGERKSY